MCLIEDELDMQEVYQLEVNSIVSLKNICVYAEMTI